MNRKQEADDMFSFSTDEHGVNALIDCSLIIATEVVPVLYFEGCFKASYFAL